MRLIISLCIAVLVTGCQDRTSKQKPVLSQPADTLKLIELISFNETNNTSLYIVNGAALFLIPDHPDKPEYCRTRTIFYDSKNKRFHFGKLSSLISYAKTVSSLAKSDETMLVIKSIGNSEFRYLKFKKELQAVKNLNEIIKPDTRIQFYKRQYYFIDEEAPRALFKYDTVTKKLSSFQLTGIFMKVTGFFLHDMDKDGEPEVFIFQTGVVPRDYVTSYSIYSIRKDSITVNFK